MAADDETKGGGSPEHPFSNETLVLYQRLQRCTSKEERTGLMLELAAQFVGEHDPSDSTATDDYHKYFEEYDKARMAYTQAAMKIGRLASECVKTYLATTETTIEEATRAKLRLVR